MLLEIRRLHELYKAGSFDWASTPTSLKWLLALRRTKQIPVAVFTAAQVPGDATEADDDGSERSYDDELLEANLLGCTGARLGGSVVPGRVASAMSFGTGGTGIVSDAYTEALRSTRGFPSAGARLADVSAGAGPRSTMQQEPATAPSAGQQPPELQQTTTPGTDARTAAPRFGYLGLGWGLLCAFLLPVACQFLSDCLVPLGETVGAVGLRVLANAAATVGRVGTSIGEIVLRARMSVLRSMWDAIAFLAWQWFGDRTAARAGVETVAEPVLHDSVRTSDLLVDSPYKSSWGSAASALGVGCVLLLLCYAVMVGSRMLARLRPWTFVLMLLSWLQPGAAFSVDNRALSRVYDVSTAYLGQLRCASQSGTMVVSCGCSVAQLTGSVSALSAASRADQPWSDGLWVVDSGAELMIAGSFIYPKAQIVLRKPDIYVKDVRGELTQVDAVVRTVVTLPDGDHCIREVLVCDSFELALWSTEYMRHFGFAALLMEAGAVSSIRTPTGCMVELTHRPYRVHAPCRMPTQVEFAHPSAVPVDPHLRLSTDGVGAGAVSLKRSRPGKALQSGEDVWPLVSEREAWRLHAAWMHTGWRTLSHSLRVRFPLMPPCEVCRLTQSKRQPLAAQPQQATFAGQLTASDTWGPFMGALYFDGCRYIVVFVDVFSKVRFAVFCRDRTSATLLEAYKCYRGFMRCCGVEVCGEWLTDGGPEYVSEMAFDFCDDYAIRRLLSTRYEPRSNGTAEAVFRVYVPRVRSAILAAHLPKQLYALAFQYSLYLANRTFSRSIGCSPLERLPHPPVVNHSRAHPFGCRVWAHQPDIDRADKLSPTSRAGVFVGVSEIYKGYVVYYPETQEFESSVHCVFDDGCFPMLDAAPPPAPHTPLPVPVPLPPLHVRERVRAPSELPTVPPPRGADLEAPASGSRALQTQGPTGSTVPRDRTRQAPEARSPAPRRLFTAASPHLQRVAPLPPAVPLRAGVRQDTRRVGSRATAADRFQPGVSIAIVAAWSASAGVVAAVQLSQSPLEDGLPVVVVLFSGVERPGSLPEALRSRGAAVVPIDTSIGGRLHDLLDQTPESIGWHLLRAARRGEVHALHVALPCETFSVARDDADMVRSSATPEFQMGLPGLPPWKAASVFASNTLIQVSLDIAMAVWKSGGQVTVENPAPRCDVQMPHVFWPEKSHHANLFHTLPVQRYQVETASTLVVFPLCACGSPMQKYIAVLATPAAAHVLAPLDGLVCTHGGHDERAYGMKETGELGGLLSAQYPPMFSAVLACALLRLTAPGLDRSGVSPLVLLQAAASVERGSRHLAEASPYSSPDSHILCEGPVTARCVGLLREEAVSVPGYAQPDNPGWWAEADADGSDAEDEVFSVRMNGVSQAYQACVKVPLAVKAAIRSRFSDGPGGVTEHVIPSDYDAARVHPECAGIWEAMVREMNAHSDCGTWELRPAAECYAMGKEPIGCMWVYDCKIDATTLAFMLWRARLVARGDQMVFMRDYLETYSGVVKHTTWRLFLAMCAQLDLVLTGSDVSTAYLHAPLRDYVVWMKQPRGFVETIDGQPALCRLKMALYGLKQSAREWAITVIAWLTSWGFKQCVSDRYLFVYTSDEGTLVLLIWVDDIFIGHDSASLRGRFMKEFSTRFRVKDLGPLRQALGASVSQSIGQGWVSFSLEKYITDLARRLNLLDNVAWADIPLPMFLLKNCLASAPTVAEVASTVEEYGALVGSIVFIATFARPDVAFSAHFLSRFLVRPGPVHLQLARRVLGYLSRTRAMAITYRKGSGDPQMSFSPLDDGLPDRTGRPHLMVDTDHGIARSVTGWLFMYAGAATAWAVRGQTQPSLSSAESELYGLSTGLCAMLVCVQTLEEMRVVFSAPVPVLTDSRGARLLASDCAVAARTRHIHRRWFFVQHHLEEGHVVLKAVKGSQNPSNFLTKAVGGASFAADRAYALGLTKVGSM